jgi:HAD superfamily phosphatase (TIGR01668 family)
MKKSESKAVLPRIALAVVFLATLPISLPYRAFELLEGNDMDRNIATLMFLADFLVGLAANLAGLPGMYAFLVLMACAMIAGYSMEVVHGIQQMPKKKRTNLLRPSIHIRNIFEINGRKLWDMGFRVLVIDIDHTLVSTKSWRVSVKTRRKLKELQKMGFRIVFLTNTVVPWRQKRAREIAKSAKIDVILVCCDFFHCKPSRWGFEEACRLAGVAAEKAVMIGDMLLRDIFGANKAGYGFTILVEPKGPDNLIIRRSRRKELEIKKWLAEIGLIRSQRWRS